MFIKAIKHFARDERGVSAMEYAVLAGIVVLAVAAGGLYLSNDTTGIPGLFKNLMTTVNTKATGG
ncbi:Flp family type IVb pilin [Paraburkholderia sabiae]|uniref:Flp family type IVb pilin n=1 Tax=Paraburkholderia sabiae TaxID=273251 RepID=UPI001CB5C494|nr:Flp family type IVb pilin [Paraburkholderia sabiae]CAG9202902.1 Flp family type IVb pilin [Paraburkholderia sabiae]